MFPTEVCYANDPMVSLRQEKQPTDAPACFQSWLGPSRISAVTVLKKKKKKNPRLSFLKCEAQSLFYQEQNPLSVTAVRWKR